MDATRRAIQKFAELYVLKAISGVTREIRTLISQTAVPGLYANIIPLLRRLEERAPFHEERALDGLTYADILTAGWSYQLQIGDECEDEHLAGRFTRDGTQLATNAAAEYHNEIGTLLRDAVERLGSSRLHSP